MSLSTRTRSLSGALSAAALLTLLALAPGPAGAADKPTACGEPLLTDKVGDQVVDPLGAIDPIGLGLLAHKGPDNSDITSVFLNFAGGILTANIEVTNLDKTIPPPTDSQGGIAYYAFWTFGGSTRFVRAHNQTGSDYTYGYGTVDSTGVYTTDGTTKGTTFDGPKGVVQIEIPAAAGGKADASLKGVVATIDGFSGGPDDASGFNNNFDRAPDNASSITPNGKNFEVAECSVTTTPTAPVGTTPATTELPLKVTKVVDGAKKAKRTKALSLKVTASEAISNLSVSLKAKNGKGDSYASGKASQVSGTATLKLKVLKAKKLKAGTYALVAKGTVGGAVRKATLTVKVKK
ncbi:MAG: hypothetical protein QOI98_1789 [Solirubrobacteraceae bacterium]|nr:hypothetical protein [Solirubrobacteraceae bacterium]